MKNWRGRSGFVARLGQGSLVCLLALGVGAQFIGCSSEPISNAGDEQSGSIGLNLDAAPGVTLNAVTYTITGNGFTKTGAIDTSGSPTISGTIGGIPAGKGYTITLTATSVEGNTTFTGSATLRRDRRRDDVGDDPSERLAQDRQRLRVGERHRST